MTSVLRPATLEDVRILSCIHAECFQAPWSEGVIAGFLCREDVSGVLQADASGPASFLLVSRVSDTADILTIATAPRAQRAGHARQLIRALIEGGRGSGLGRVTLEVAEDNRAARRLYESEGFRRDGVRPGYYRRADGAPMDAVLYSFALV